MENHEKRQRQGTAITFRDGAHAQVEGAQLYGEPGVEVKGEGWYVQVPISYQHTLWTTAQLAPNLWEKSGVIAKKVNGLDSFERGSIAFMCLNTSSYTRLHKDACNTLLLAVAGTRKVWLAAPGKYVVDRGGWNCMGTSMLPECHNPAAPEYEPLNHPWLGEEPITLNPGDAILFPKDWWHVVQGEKNSVAIGIELSEAEKPTKKLIRNVGRTRGVLGWSGAERVFRIMAEKGMKLPASQPALIARIVTRSNQSLIQMNEQDDQA